jgi:hypothetical protein
MYSAGDDKLTKREALAAPMEFARMSERLSAMNDKNWRPRTEALTKDSPAPEEGVSQEDAVTDVEVSDELSTEEQNLEDGQSGEQLLTDPRVSSNGTEPVGTEAPSWAADAAAAAASWQAEHPDSS